MENQGNMISPKNHNNLLITEHKDMKISDLLDKEFKVIILKKLSELQEAKKDNSAKSGKQYMNKMNLTKRNHKKELNRDSGAEKYNE